MVTVVVGVLGALVYGSSDFLGGLASKRISPLWATAISALTGFGLLAIFAPFVGGEWSGSAILWGALAGVSGAIALSLLYACLAIGPMSILSPLTAVVSAIVPLTWGLLGGDRFSVVGYLALGLIVIAVILVGFVPEKGAVRPSLQGILMAIGSGLMIGVFLSLLDASPDDSGLIPILLYRSISGMTLLGTIAVLWLWRRRRGAAEIADARTPWKFVRFGILLAMVCGLVDAGANSLLLLGLRLGDLSVMGVLIASSDEVAGGSATHRKANCIALPN